MMPTKSLNGAAACAILSTLFGAPGEAQLFEDSAELEVALDFPMRQVIRAKSEEEFPATLTYTDAAGNQTAITIDISTRGNSRLGLCDVPPLRLDVKRESAAGTLFEGQDELKLVTQCKREAAYRDYLLIERKIYQAYNLVTPLSFRTRMLRVTYRDSEQKTGAFTDSAFLLEDIDEVAARVDMRRIRQPRISPSTMDPAQRNVVAIFEFMIGNTDWSMLAPRDGEEDCCHNFRVLAPGELAEAMVAIPYDFDQAGLIDAEYALPSPMLNTRSVRQRVYRGLCADNEHVESSIRQLVALGPELEKLFAAGDLSDRAAQKTTDYLQGFYEVAASPQAVRRQIYDACVGGD